MKILFLSDDIPPHNTGGAGIVAFRLAGGLKELGHSVVILTTTRNKAEEDLQGTELDGLRIFKIYSNYNKKWRPYLSIYNPQVIRKIKNIISSVKPDVVNAHNIHTYLSYHSLRIGKNSGAKVILTAHDAMSYSFGKVDNNLRETNSYNFIYKLKLNPFRNTLIRYYLGYVDKVIAVSDSLAVALRNNDIKKVVTVHNGIDVNRWTVSEDQANQFKILHHLNGKKVVLYSGRLDGAKGGEQIVRAMAKVVKEIPETILLIAGKKEDYAKIIIQSAVENNIVENLIFSGWLDAEEMKKAYFVSDLVVTPSLYLDPFPTVNLEAMATKKPVVGTCFGGTPEVVVDNKTGFIVDPDNIELMASKIIILLKDTNLAHTFGEAGYDRVKNKFSQEQQLKEYVDIYLR
jgi:glycosyltransferase involved in cell wall biosynthesis